MKVTLTTSKCVVERTTGDPKFDRKGNKSWGTAESRLLHHVKKALQSQGLDVIKRRLQADGHLMGNEETQYLRERKHRFYIYDEAWAIRDLAEEFDRTGTVTLSVQRNNVK